MRPDSQTLLCTSAGAVVGGQSEFRVGSSSALVGIETGNHIFCASHVPAPCFFRALFIGSERGLLKERSARLPERVPHPAHKVRELAVQLLSFTPKPLRRLCPLPVQHGAKPQPLKQRIRHHADGPAAEVVAFFVLGARLRHLHESRFLEQGNGPLDSALADAGIPHDGAHVDVDKSAGGRGNAQAHGSKVKVAQNRFQHDLTGLTAF